MLELNLWNALLHILFLEFPSWHVNNGGITGGKPGQVKTQQAIQLSLRLL